MWIRLEKKIEFLFFEFFIEFYLYIFFKGMGGGGCFIGD